MGTRVTITEAKKRFPELIARVEAGEEVVISRRGVPAARLIPLDSPLSLVPRTRAENIVSGQFLEKWDELEAEYQKIWADYFDKLS
jgi:prevent-host-death family protein